jgi:signal transduction histidine kinase
MGTGTKNELVKNIIFHQSHTVRRPLANILGIVEIINHNKSTSADMELQEMISLLKISTDDLDKAIKLNLPVENL